MVHLRLRPALAAAAVTVAAGATLAAATAGSTPQLSALSDYVLFHGGLGHAALDGRGECVPARPAGLVAARRRKRGVGITFGSCLNDDRKP